MSVQRKTSSRFEKMKLLAGLLACCLVPCALCNGGSQNSNTKKAYKPTERIQRCVEVQLDPGKKEDYEYCKDAMLEAQNNMEVHRLLEKGHDPDRKLDWQGRTKLILATFKGQKDVVAELINYGQADVSAKALTGHTALMYAAGEGHTDLMQMFLAAGASVNDAVTGMRNKDGTRPKDYSAVKAAEGFTALHFACRSFKLRASALLLDAGAHMDVKEHTGSTPLQFAMRSPSKHVRNRFKMLFDNVRKLREEAEEEAAKRKRKTEKEEL